ncbi:hypothetical protein LUZ61_011783 [Rhynchospora tenuis]|uniref:F-box domain-containing protein n=1 Tax=Rhynchospora tenuis TaxID=198213 RepID=A0AAD6A1U5_9POAL|nr:hypothetical protein LUZ61_011783 [Rhynchospora tenuis]
MDWSELPLDPLHLISKRLPDLSDFIRFSAVCKSWRSAAPLADLPPQLPWVVARRHPWACTLTSEVRLYSLYTGKFYSVNLPEAKGKILLGSSHHYMLTFNQKSRFLSLLNLFTRSEISLPPTNSEWHCPLYIGPDPIQSGDDVVISWQSSNVLTVGFCRPGDQEWKKIRIPAGMLAQAYYKGMFYVTERKTLATKVIDIKTGATLSTIPPPIYKNTREPCHLDYLVMSSGELLGVHKYKFMSWDRDNNRNYEFIVYRLDGENEVLQWIRIDSIGDRVLFLDGKVGFCLSTSEYKGFKGDCIYFISPFFDNVDGFIKYPLYRYDMKNGRVKDVSRHLGDMASWFFPGML